MVGLLGGGIAAVLGMSIGFIAGYRGGIVDEVLNMVTNIVLVLPTFVVLIVLSAYLGINSLVSQAVFIGLFTWPWVARAVRAQTLLAAHPRLRRPRPTRPGCDRGRSSARRSRPT